MIIQSERLDLIPMTAPFLRASLAGDFTEAARHMPAALAPEWPGPDSTYFLELRLGQLEKDASLQPWLTRAVVLRDANRMVGYIGFHTAPAQEYLEPFSPGGVEFGFTVFPDFQRRGYAHEAARALMQWARTEHRVPAFVLTISPGNAPSQALARKLGFIKIGSHMDEIDGEEDVLELKC